MAKNITITTSTKPGTVPADFVKARQETVVRLLKTYGVPIPEERNRSYWEPGKLATLISTPGNDFWKCARFVKEQEKPLIWKENAVVYLISKVATGNLHI